MEKNTARFCSKCGNPLNGDEKFCNVCGEKIMKSEDTQYVPNNTINNVRPNKKNGCLKSILIGIGILFILFIILAVMGSGNSDGASVSASSSAQIESTEIKAIEQTAREITQETVLETTQESTNSSSIDDGSSQNKAIPSLNLSKTNIDIILALDDLGQAFENPFSLTDNQKAFINKHLSFFPANYDDLKNMSEYIDYELDYSHMIKNPQRYSGKLAYSEDLTIVQIWETSLSDEEYDNYTELNLSDSDDNLYRVLYFGKSIDVVEDDMIRVVAMPLAYSSYTNTVGEQKLTLVMVASLFEHIDGREISKDFFTDEPDEIGAALAVDIATDEDYILPGSDSRYYSERELSGFTKGELRLGRNEIYARHGRIFEADDLKNYFQSQGWYYGYLTASEFDESVLNIYEKENLLAIKAVESTK